ncbi:hypothetical protein BV898_09241 [Hypsibius exemplaris]|uniref:SGNH domain-containing protein n=1 Tax=Hypsibius exemplaris TaxID=2072580 RepID=A0A1W0WN30_HYPEX|nr:hypothetical protein BV898_09241 [Hypsibius exemplaris]
MAPVFCEAVLEKGRAKDGRDVCPWNELNSSFTRNLELFMDKSVVLIGESRMRHLYDYLVRVISLRDMNAPYERYHSDAHSYFEKSNVTLAFHWCPYPDDCVRNVTKSWMRTNSTPQYVILGVGIYSAAVNVSPSPLKTFSENLHRTFAHFSKLPSVTLIWVEILPVTRKWAYNRGRPEDRAAAIPLLKKMRTAANHIAANHSVPVWRSAFTAAHKHRDFFTDGIHFNNNLLQKVACLLLGAIGRTNC